MFETWRARRALLGHKPPTSVATPAPEALAEVVAGLRAHLGRAEPVGDPIWQLRLEGEQPLVGLDVRKRSVSDIRQRLVRTLHELDLRHLKVAQRRVLAALLVPPGALGEGWLERLLEGGDDGLRADWNRLRPRVALLLVEKGGAYRLHDPTGFGADAVTAWDAARGA